MIAKTIIQFIFPDQHSSDDLTTARGFLAGLKLNQSSQSRQHHTSDRPPPRPPASSLPPINRHTINQLKNQIKYVLNIDLHTPNDTIDKYIIESFNLHNPDPTYVFVLPDASNQTLTFRRSNFSDISFPNTSTQKILQNILKSSKFAHLFPSHDERLSKQLALDQRFFTKYQQFMSTDMSDLHEAESLRIVEENVRTEKNFFKYMDKLNGAIDNDAIKTEQSTAHQHRPSIDQQHSTDYPTLIRQIHAKKNIANYALARDNVRDNVLARDHVRAQLQAWPTTKKSISWDDFGLPGWVGPINEHHENPDENG